MPFAGLRVGTPDRDAALVSLTCGFAAGAPRSFAASGDVMGCERAVVTCRVLLGGAGALRANANFEMWMKGLCATASGWAQPCKP
ncbi:hypothetical protein ABIA45_000424 [Bradyrhizobium sp. USDA 336]